MSEGISFDSLTGDSVEVVCLQRVRCECVCVALPVPMAHGHAMPPIRQSSSLDAGAAAEEVSDPTRRTVLAVRCVGSLLHL